MNTSSLFLSLALASLPCISFAQQTDANTPLHLLKPDYKIAYQVPTTENVKETLDRVFSYVDKSTPYALKDENSLQTGTFRLTSYEWGVTYSAMLKVAEITGDKKYSEYVSARQSFLASQVPHFRKLMDAGKLTDGQMRQMINPRALDDAGAVCTSMIKMQMRDKSKHLTPLIENYMDFILNKEYRLADGIFARKRPQYNSVWLDDMFMGIPPIAWYGRLNDNTAYYDEAVRQIMLFKQRMWVEDKNLFRHGWIEAADYHPSFFWGRANGWAFLTMTEVLDALPKDHPGREGIMTLYKKHAAGLASLQGSEGFWHQLLDRNDSYLETSATAIYVYCMAHGINEGWLNPLSYGPAVILGWNAVCSKINQQGQVLGTCVGTGMGFDPAFYYYRPVSPYAAHGYGPVLMAGAEVIRLLNTTHPRLNDSAIQFYCEDMTKFGPLFQVEK
ncbi:MAG: glycoside hydrolase family 88 protein [Prevotellaceae bacterium]|nr:glycoside hydrolase family 88 protein [Prevotellaceae bacterium]